MFDISAKSVSELDEIYGVETIDWENSSWKYLSLVGVKKSFNTLQLNDEVKCLLLRLGETAENFTGRIQWMSVFNDISCGSRDNEKECESNAQLVSLCAKRFGIGQWYCSSEDSPQGEWDKMAEKMLLEFAESGHPIFRATSPLSRGQLKSKGHGKLSIHCCADLETIKAVFRIIISVNQLSLYGAVAEM